MKKRQESVADQRRTRIVEQQRLAIRMRRLQQTYPTAQKQRKGAKDSLRGGLDV
jgi:hypothetical protein